VARLAHGQDRIHVDVRIHEGRGEEPAFRVELTVVAGREFADRSDRGDPVAFDEDIDRVRATTAGGMDPGLADDHTHSAVGTPCGGTTLGRGQSPAARPPDRASVRDADRRRQVGQGRSR
jgi:hypothetical protein